VNRVLAVFLKELVDGLRDKRSMLSLFLFPLLGPVMASVIMAQTAEQIGVSDRLVLPVIGSENAPALIAYLKRQGVRVVAPPNDHIAALRDGDVDLVLIIPAEYGARFRAGQTATVQLIVDESRTETMAAIDRIGALVQAHSRTIGSLRLLARGVSPDLASPVELERVDLSTPKRRAAIFLSLIPMFALIASFLGGMYIATDTTAGERERGSLEPLLITPVGRHALVLGKWFTVLLFSMSNVVLTLACTLASLQLIPTEHLGINLALGAGDVARLLLAVLPLTMLVAASQILLSSFARTFKEAQTYLSLMVFIPMLPAVLTMLNPLDGEPWMMFMPVLAQQLIMVDVIKGVAVPPLAFVLAALSSLIGALVCMRIAAALFRREHIIFGRSGG
jgi:sodium transport system permease protein